MAELLRAASPRELPLLVAYLTGEIPGGKLNAGPALLREALEAPTSRPSDSDGTTLELLELQEQFETLRATRGAGSKRKKLEQLRSLFQHTNEEERNFLASLLLGELRQGSLEGLMADAISKAFDVPLGDVRRAAMLSGDLSATAETAAHAGQKGLSEFGLELFRPIKPMLASPAEDIEEAQELFERVRLELKLDGARVQVHKAANEVRVYTRALNEVTHALPELLELARSLTSQELVVEIAFNELQASPHYPAGLALRFARVKGYRPDKAPEEADTIETVRRIHAGSLDHRLRGL